MHHFMLSDALIIKISFPLPFVHKLIHSFRG